MASTNDDKKKLGKPAGADATPPPQAAELQQIRDILFGEQVEDINARLEQLDLRNRSEKTELRVDVVKRLTALEAFVKGELGALSERLRNEREERSRAFRQVAKEIREGLEAMEKRIAEVSARGDDDLHELREQFLTYSQTVRDEIRSVTEEGASLPH